MQCSRFSYSYRFLNVVFYIQFFQYSSEYEDYVYIGLRYRVLNHSLHRRRRRRGYFKLLRVAEALAALAVCVRGRMQKRRFPYVAAVSSVRTIALVWCVLVCAVLRFLHIQVLQITTILGLVLLTSTLIYFSVGFLFSSI